MSLFGSYIQEAYATDNETLDLNNTVFEGVEADVNANINESMNVLAFMSGAIVAESNTFEALLGLTESAEVSVLVEAKFDGLKERFGKFVEKVLQFFADLSMKIQANVLSKVAKMNKKGVLKKNVKVYDITKDTEYEKAINTIVAAINKLESFSGASDIEDLGEINVDFNDEHFAKCQVELKMYSSVAEALKYLDHGKAVIKNNKKTMAECKKLKAKFDKIGAKANAAVGDEVDKEALDNAAVAAFAKKATALMNAAIDVTKSVSNQMFKNAIAIGSASASDKGAEDQKKLTDESEATKKKKSDAADAAAK